MTFVRVDADAVARWSGTLGSLSPLRPLLPSCPESDAALGGWIPAAATLDRTNVDGLRALAEVVGCLDTLVSDLYAATRSAAGDYPAVDSWVVSRMERDDRG
jgi:hypothetical protein